MRQLKYIIFSLMSAAMVATLFQLNFQVKHGPSPEDHAAGLYLQKASSGFGIDLRFDPKGILHAEVHAFRPTTHVHLKWILPPGVKTTENTEIEISKIDPERPMTFILPLEIPSQSKSQRTALRVIAQVSGRADQAKIGSSEVIDLFELDSNGRQVVPLEVRRQKGILQRRAANHGAVIFE